MTQTGHQPATPRLLALDPGDRRTGVAISDELGLFAHPRPALMVRDRSALCDAVAGLVDREQIDEVIIGLPLAMSGGDTAQTRIARAVAEQLRARLRVPVTAWDERLSSREAARHSPGVARRRSGELDSAAAAVVLQAVLDARSRRAAR